MAEYGNFSGRLSDVHDYVKLEVNYA